MPGTVSYTHLLDELGAHLAALGADRMVVAAQKAKMDAYLRSKNMENVDVDPAKMAEGIMEKLKSEAADRAAEQAHGEMCIRDRPHTQPLPIRWRGSVLRIY